MGVGDDIDENTKIWGKRKEWGEWLRLRQRRKPMNMKLIPCPSIFKIVPLLLVVGVVGVGVGVAVAVVLFHLVGSLFVFPPTSNFPLFSILLSFFFFWSDWVSIDQNGLCV